jgi:hypothetical protein
MHSHPQIRHSASRHIKDRVPVHHFNVIVLSGPVDLSCLTSFTTLLLSFHVEPALRP